MSLTVRPNQPGDIETIGKSAAEKWVRDAFNSGADFSQLYDRPLTEVVVLDGRPVAAGGYIDCGDGHAISWGLVGTIPRQHFVGVCRAFQGSMRRSPFRTIEAHCFEDFIQSHRWCRCLGYRMIHEPAQLAPDGRRFLRFIFRNEP